MRPRRLPFPAALALAIALLVTLFGVAILLPPALAPSALDLGGASTAPTDADGSPVTNASPPAATGSGSGSAKPSAEASKPTVAKTSAAPIPTSRPTVEAGVIAWEDQVTKLVNAERKKAGCGALRTDEHLRQAARAHSGDMVKFNFFSHKGHDGSDFVQRIERAGYPKGSAASENIAYGYGSPAAVVKGWMGSAGHKANILNCGSKAVGVGLVYKGTTPYWTQDFGRS
ncbi:uncharacterized protein YkwD [Allocatelliglobosispora scoriae]|uniref:Uncharacterized protein YkwD n=1 Tax=Allocatelliglobosispora scoriae TaxID=643052 RepID=A0A841BZ64_9ACTN|nr:CAP domain-containing protein [Allocatelliglobosispora scoriae]MBB5872203.1 uncharacterized protein YkwD [Allocatelliglobosispora scoriae]